MQSDEHFLTVCRYVERIALRAGLAARAEAWRRGSLWRHQASDVPAEPRLSRWPIERPPDWTLRVNLPMTRIEEEAVRRSIRRGQPYGTAPWQVRTASRLCLESTFRPHGRPPKKRNIGS